MPKEVGAPKKHISTACTWCRNRKVKCDGQTPTCCNCTLYKQKCEYTRGDKRKLSHKRTIQSLTNRVAMLENLLMSYGIEVPPDTSSDTQLSDPKLGENADASQRANEGGSSYMALLDFNQHAYITDLESLMQFGKSVDTLMGMNEGVDVQPDPTDVTELFRPPHDSSHPVYDFSQANNGSQNMMQSGQQTASREHDSLQIDSTKPDRPPSYSVPSLPVSNMAEAHDSRGTDARVPITTLHSMEGPWRESHSTNEPNDGTQSLSQPASQNYSADQGRESDDDEVLNQLSGRIGAFQIAEDGQLRYFGATSNLHILHDGLSSLPRALGRSVRVEGEEVLARAGLHRSINRDLERHLEDLYFRWEDPAIHVVDEEMYFLSQSEHYEGHDSPFYSETLKNAICAAGSCLISRPDLSLPHNAAEFFSSRAKLLLEIEMDSPSIATVQALVIMSAMEAASTRDARGWLYSGMAVRLSADLGLHLDPTNDLQDGTISSRELDVRRTTFWGVFTQDNMWSLYLGRPWGINIQGIFISRPPKELDKVRCKRWTLLSDQSEETTDKDQDTSGWYDPVESCADANVSLCAMMRELSQAVYAGKTLSDGELWEFAESMRLQLDTWHKALPAELAIDMSDESRFYLPHILQLHMQFYAISILLHRPFFSRRLNLSQQDSNHPRDICIIAAQSIVKLLRIYRKHHTLRRTNVHLVHLVFTASLICIYNAYSSKGISTSNSLNDLQFCCQALGEIGQAYQNATRALEVIICIKREWFSKMRSFSRVNRRNRTADIDAIDDETRRKRRLTQNQSDRHLVTSSTANISAPSDGGMGQLADQDSEQLDPWYFQPMSNDQQVSPDTFLENMFVLR